MQSFCTKMALLFWCKAELRYDLKTITTYFQEEKISTNQSTTSFHNFFQEETCTFA